MIILYCCFLAHYLESMLVSCHMQRCRYLLSSAARFLRSSLLAGSPRPSAITGPCTCVSSMFLVTANTAGPELSTYRRALVILDGCLASARGLGVCLVHGVGAGVRV